MKRNTLVDLGRIVCSFGVITLHVHSGTKSAMLLNDIFWPLAVPFFFCISLFYFIDNLDRNNLESVTKKTFTRLVVPYIIWTIVYATLLTSKSILLGQPNKVTWWRALFYGESGLHLFFISNLLAMQAIVVGIWMLNKKILYGIGILVIVALYLFVASIIHPFTLESNSMLIGWFMFMSAAYIYHIYKERISNNSLVAMLALGITISAILINIFQVHVKVFNYSVTFAMGGIALTLFCLTNIIDLNSAVITSLSRYSFGIYLIHVVFLEFMESAIEMSPYSDIKYGFFFKLFMTVLIFFVSMIATAILSKSLFLRRILFGEVSPIAVK